VTDPAVREVVRKQVLAERDGKVWPSFDADALFELRIERCLLMLTQPDGTFPQGATVWHAPLVRAGHAFINGHGRGGERSPRLLR
jgi:hypothetical protein